MDVRLSLELPRLSIAPEIARHALDAYRNVMVPSALDDARIVLTELVANSVRHGRGDSVQVQLHLDARGSLRGEVVDDGDGFEPPRADPGEHDTTGRGLPIVDAIVDDWGIRSGSTHVWFEMTRTAAGLSA